MMLYMHAFLLVNGMNRKYYIIIGSKKYFHNYTKSKEEPISFLDLVRISDALSNSKNKDVDFSDLKTNILIIKNDCYHGITEQAHDRLGNMIEEFTTEDATIYIHNPPKTLKEYILAKKSIQLCEVIIEEEEYNICGEVKDFSTNIANIEKIIIGQHSAVMEMAKSMWFLLHTKRKKPYVVMLYGKSSLGKTELVRTIANYFYNGMFLEKHLSMFQNGNYADYFFGEKPNRKTLGYDLLERKSNLVFLDEIDKCPSGFYSAFYTLFDNEIFQEASYEVDISNMLIVITSNYVNEKEMQENLGLPVFYRIDKFIHFKEFDESTIYQITRNEIKRVLDEMDTEVEFNQIYKVVSKQIKISGENARTIKNKVQNVIEEETFKSVSEAVKNHIDK